MKAIAHWQTMVATWKVADDASLCWLCVWSITVALLLAACNGGARQMPGQPVTQVATVVGNAPDGGAVTLPPSGNPDVPLDDVTLIAMGEMLYVSNCAPCHHPNGEGNLATFPALNRNAFVTVSDPTAVIDTVLNGREIMPAFEVTLSAQEVAAVISYIRNAWNNQAPTVSAQQVRSVQGEVETALPGSKSRNFTVEFGSER